MMRQALLVGILLAQATLALPVRGYEGKEQAHKAVVRQMMTEVFNKGNFAFFDQVYAPDYTQTDPAGRKQSFKAVKDSLMRQRQAVPDVQAAVIQLIAEGDWVAGRYYFAGTFTNDFTTGTGQKIPATNKPVMYMASTLHRFNDKDQVVEEIFVRDELSVYMQLGVIPMPKNAPAMQPLALKDIKEIAPKPMSPDTMALVRKNVMRVADEAFTQGKFAILEEGFDQGYKEYDNDLPPFGLDSFKTQIMALRAAIPDLQASTDPIIVDGDWAAFVFKYGGTFKNALVSRDGQKLPPTGKPLQVYAIVFAHVNEQGKATEVYLRSDDFSFLMQAGVIKP